MDEPLDAFRVIEGDTGSIVVEFADETGTLVPLDDVDAITIDLYRANGNTTTYINDRQQQSVFNLNGGTYYDDPQSAIDTNGNEVRYNFRWDFSAQDVPFLRADAGQQTEEHILQIRFEANGSSKSIRRTMIVENLRGFSVE